MDQSRESLGGASRGRGLRSLLASLAQRFPEPVLLVSQAGELLWANESALDIATAAGGGASPFCLAHFLPQGTPLSLLDLPPDGSPLTRRLDGASGPSTELWGARMLGKSADKFTALLMLRPLPPPVERILAAPDRLPGPFLRISKDGVLLFANAAARPLLEHWRAEVGCGLSEQVAALARHSLEEGWGRLQVRTSGQLFDLLAIALADPEEVILYGEDVLRFHRTHEELTRLTSAVEQADYLVVITDLDGCIQYVNRAFEATTGWSRRAVLGQTPRLLRSGEHPPEFYRSLWETLLSGKTYRGQITNRTRTGELYVEEKSIAPLADEEGHITHFVSTGRDVTTRLRAEEELRHSEERFALAAQGANDGLWDWDLKEDAVYFSDRWKAMLGCEPLEIGSGPEEWSTRIHPDDLEGFHANLKAHLDNRTPHFQAEYRVRHQSGSWRWMLARGLAVRDSQGRPYRMAGSQTDITARKQSEARLLHDALHDQLTGLPNRTLFMDRLSQALQRAKRTDKQYAVLFLDLDRFKIVNDSLGHALGDRLLLEIGRRLAGCIRPADTVARLSGDEFAVLLEEMREPADALRFAERALKSLGSPFSIEGREVYSSCSIGIAQSGLGYESPEEMLRDADTAMYRAKATGKSRFVVFDRAMHQEALSLLELETDLRRATERHDFQLHYQPIVSLATGKIAGFEALVRWPHETKGFIPPSRFIPLAEETGLIIPMGNRILRDACRQLRTWQGKHARAPKLHMAVNLSGVQMLQPELIMQIDLALREFGLDGRTLKLEITESVIMEHAQYALEMLQQIKALNIRLAIDDFGTGYSSMSYLRRYPIDTVKVDQSFVAKINVDEECLEIVRSTITMAHNLKMDVVAEGVETAEQLARIRALGCDYAQGYFFSRPVDRDTAEALLSGGLSW